MALRNSNVIAQFNVLSQGCSATALSSAISANNPEVLLLQSQAALALQNAAKLAEMKARLDLLLSSALDGSNQPAKISITGNIFD